MPNGEDLRVTLRLDVLGVGAARGRISLALSRTLHLSAPLVERKTADAQLPAGCVHSDFSHQLQRDGTLRRRIDLGDSTRLHGRQWSLLHLVHLLGGRWERRPGAPRLAGRLVLESPTTQRALGNAQSDSRQRGPNLVGQFNGVPLLLCRVFLGRTSCHD